MPCSERPYDWFPDQGWQDLIRLVQLGQTKLGPDGRMHPFSRLADDIESEERMWREYYELEAPEEASLPMGYDQSLSEFEKLLVLRCLRMDRVTVGITRCVHKKFSRRPRSLTACLLFEKTTCLTALAPARPFSPRRFVISVMTERYVQPPVLDYRMIFKQSKETTPIVFVLSPGKSLARLLQASPIS